MEGVGRAPSLNMNDVNLHTFSAELLTLLEREEAGLLVWGFYDTAFTPEDVEARVLSNLTGPMRNQWEKFASEGWTPQLLLQEMANAGLLFQPRAGDVYRSRFCEFVRLSAHLRQRFSDADWTSAPNLVGDLKLHLSWRRYPDLTESAADCLAELHASFTQPDLQTSVFNALAQRNGQAMKFSGFQRRAFVRILGQYAHPQTSGTVISAGTGAGKTKAFYMPAFLGIAAELSGCPFTKVIAVYPRNVLLADQLREAMSEVAKLWPAYAQFKLRPIRFAALLGPTPHANWFTPNAQGQYLAARRGWRRVSDGWIVPYLQSPADGRTELIWRDSDRVAGRTALYTNAGTQPVVPDGELAITREQMIHSPPDVLFLSLEMLNREMGNPEWRAVFGLDDSRPPVRLVLLDEMHTHEGLAGAQAAWVLRRWRFWGGQRSLHTVGLSATLRQAPRHLAHLAQLDLANVSEIKPLDKELVSESMHYQVMLKSDPASQASLLSTSIQAGMLLRRVLTPANQANSHRDALISVDRLYGRKVFAFTDNLDIVNRWYSDFWDAEMRQQLARWRMHPEHRAVPPTPPPSSDEIRQRDMEGQVWELCRRLGHDLELPLMLGRCSSQDPGIDTRADLVVATSALEVGYDDPFVGATLHHKRPRSMASFLQRQGRAGRVRGSRPWTVMVLSDYGSDRWAFQHSDRYFEPIIEAISLPILNPYVLRVQAAFFLIDWLGRRINDGAPFKYLAQSGSGVAREKAMDLLNGLVTLGQSWHEFRAEFMRFFQPALDGRTRVLPENAVEDLLWNPPTPLLTQVAPTLLRKLEAKWSVADPSKRGEHEDVGVYRPIPRYLPKATFADHEGAEVRINLQNSTLDDQYMSVGHALAETCPGRVSKRFAPGEKEAGYWQSCSAALPEGAVGKNLREIYPDSIHVTTVGDIQVYRPLSVQLTHRPRGIANSSNSVWAWEADLRPRGSGWALGVLAEERWSRAFTDCSAFLHRDRAAVRVVRYARSCRYEIAGEEKLRRKGEIILRASDGSRGETPEAVGYLTEVDGLLFRVNPQLLRNAPAIELTELTRARAEYFLHRLRTHPALKWRLNYFSAEWIWRIDMAMLTESAMGQGIKLRDAAERMTDRAVAADQVIASMLRDRVGAEADGQSRLGESLRGLWRDPLVVATVREVERSLWMEPDEDFARFLRQRLVATLAAALRISVVRGMEQVQSDDLQVDVAWADEFTADIYLTETAPGGLGQVEAVGERLRRHPHQLAVALEHTLAYCPANALNEQLKHALTEVIRRPDGPLSESFSQVRAARDVTMLSAARDQLHRQVANVGLLPSRDVLVATAVHLLYPGSSRASDEVMHTLNQLWPRLERRLGLPIDGRVMAYLAARWIPSRSRLLRRLAILGAGEPSIDMLCAWFERLLLQECHDSCRECLHDSTGHDPVTRPSRSLAKQWIGLEESSIDIQAADVVKLALDALRAGGRVRLRCESGALDCAALIALDVARCPLYIQGLLTFVRIGRVHRDIHSAFIELVTDEGFHD